MSYNASRRVTMADWDYRGQWYHGSQQPLTALRTGSSITGNPETNQRAKEQNMAQEMTN